MAKYLDKEGLETYEATVKGRLKNKQDTLVSGTNIKTINNESLVGSGNISVGGGTATDVKINGTSITSNDEADIQTQGTYNATTNKIATMSDLPTVPTKVSDLTNDAGYITGYTETDPIFTASAAYNISSSDITNWNNKSTFSGNYNDLTNKPTIPSKTSDLTNDSGFIDGLTILSYGSSTWNDFLTAYQKNKVVYCRASSNSNPASGSQTRLAFMAYVNNATTPTEVEFQYYRSVSSHSDSQQGDQVFVYKLTSAGAWTVTTRNAFSKVVAGTGLSSSYSNGAITLSANAQTETDPVFSASAAAGISSSDITNWNGKQDALVSGTNIKTINNNSILGSGDLSVGDALPIGTEVTYDGASVPNGWIEVDNPFEYSTDEQKIGTWIDGKPIYRKVIDCGGLTNASTKNVTHGISNIDMVTNYTLIAKNPNANTYIAIPYTNKTNIAYQIETFIDTTKIAIICGDNKTGYTKTYAIVEYTKTTD